MDYFPLFAKLTGKPCLVVGGGAVAARKVRALLNSGARVMVNAPDLNPELVGLAAEGTITHAPGAFDPTLIAVHLLVIAATSDPDVNAAVAAVAEREQRLCNVVDDGRNSGFIMPAVIDRSPIVVAIGSGGQAPVLARLLRQRLDEWLPSRIGELACWAGKWRTQVKAYCVSHAARLRFWEQVFDGRIAERVLGGDTAAADRAMTRNLAASGEIPPDETGTGEAWIVGAGPGDPGLLTRRGLQLLQRADVILYDRLVNPEILEFARRDAKFICVGKQAGHASMAQTEINAQLIEHVRRGQRVCRLKGGDPFIFGRGGEEISALAAAGLDYQVVPGISAANGCAAYAGIPLTHRDVAGAVTFVTGQRTEAHGDADWDDTDWARLASGQHTLVVYMGGQRLEHIGTQLMRHGRAPDTPAAVIESGTSERQRVIGGTLENIATRAATAGLGSPSVLVVGEVVDLAQKLHWIGDDNERTDLRAASRG